MGIPVEFQDPSTKQRHADPILIKSGVIVKKSASHYYYKGELTNMHKRDALRHYMYYAKRRKMKLRGMK
jgi:hypothetical protein